MIGQLLLIVSLLVFVGFLVFKPQADTFCDDHRVGCSLTTGFVSTGVAVLVGYLVLFGWTIQKAGRYYRRLARGTPERLMPTSPRVRASDIVGREHLAETVARESSFARNGAPILVVGEAGSGKTTFLLRLTQHLAEIGFVPVDVRLRGTSLPLNFRQLAQDEFVRRIDPVVRAETDAKRVWRKLCTQGAVVVLADGLDDVALDLPRRERDHVIRAALLDARNEQLPVVATTRPESVPLAASASLFELAPLEELEALEYVAKRAALGDPEDRKRVADIVSAGQITHSPLYLNVISALFRLKQLPGDVGQAKELLLVELLDAWIGLLGQGSLRPEVEVEAFQRKRILERLSAAAYAMTLGTTAEMNLSQLENMLSNMAVSGAGRDIETGLMVDGANQLELIDTHVLEKDISIQFNHAITQAYFTSRYLQHNRDATAPLLDEAGSDALEAIIMSAAKSPDDAAATVSGLLTRAKTLDGDSALSFRIGAHTLTAISKAHALSGQAASAIIADWTLATPRSRLAAVRRLEGRRDADSFEILHSATRDASYRVRWAAAQAIIAAGSQSYLALSDQFASTLGQAEVANWREWTEDETHDISVLAWILPAIGGDAAAEIAEAIDAQLTRLTNLVPDGMPPGTEASLAQGYKICALTYPRASPSKGAASLLSRCSFWYSRITLLHALCISGIANDNERTAALTQMRRTAQNKNEHPLVREGARLCVKALKERDWHPYIWGDESALIAQSASGLATETAVLVGDIVLLLNLTEQGITKEEVEERKDRTYGRKDIPYCLGASRDRSGQLFHRCDERCPFDLCPYPRSAELVQARGEFSQAFCEHQIELLARSRGLRHLLNRIRPARWSRTSRVARRHFWEAMQTRAL
jgi:NACHT domain